MDHIVKLMRDNEVLDDVDATDTGLSINRCIEMLVERNAINIGDKIVVEEAPS